MLKFNSLEEAQFQSAHALKMIQEGDTSQDWWTIRRSAKAMIQNGGYTEYVASDQYKDRPIALQGKCKLCGDNIKSNYKYCHKPCNKQMYYNYIQSDIKGRESMLEFIQEYRKPCTT